MGMHFLERWLICVERFTNADFLMAEGDPPGSGVFDDITRYPNFKVDNFLQHTHCRFLSVLRTMFSTAPSQTISMLAPKAQECLVTIMLHMAHRAKKTKAQSQAPSLKRLRDATSNISTAAASAATATTSSAMGPPPPSAPNANALEAALQRAAGLMSGSRGLGASTSSEQLIAAMEAAMVANDGPASVASLAAGQASASETPAAASAEGGAPVTRSPTAEAALTSTSDNEERASVPAPPPAHADATPETSNAADAARAQSGDASDNLAQLMDMFPSVPRELVMSALVECHGDLQVSDKVYDTF